MNEQEPHDDNKASEDTSKTEIHDKLISHESYGLFGSLINWFAHNPIAANFLMLFVIVLGLNAYQNINKESFPEIEPDSVGIDIAYSTGSAQDSEEGITLKLENALEGVGGIKRITSFSQPSGSRITVVKNSDYPLEKLVADVKSAMQTVDLPKDASQPIVTEEQWLQDALWIQIYGDAEQSELIEFMQRIKADLLKQSSIEKLQYIIMPNKLVSVEISDSQLQRHNLTISDISNRINAESVKSLSTSIRDGKKKIHLAAANQDYYANDFSKIIIKTLKNGSQIRLGEIAKVSNSIEDDTLIFSRYNGKESMGIQIFSGKDTDVAKVVTQANTVVEKWQNKLPNNIHIESWLDQSKSINERLNLLLRNAITGFILVFIILALFLHIKIAFWVAAGLPFIFFGTFYFMGDSFAGLTINYITTFGFIMALGIVVDDAVVVGESIFSTRQRFGDNISSTVSGTLAVSKPTILGVITTVVTFMSLASISGNIGKIYAQFGYVVAFCLLLSIVETKLILPAHLSHIKTHRTKTITRFNLWAKLQQKADRAMTLANQSFQKLIKILLNFRYATLLVLVAIFIFVVGLPLSGKIRIVFFPDIPGDILMVKSSVYSEVGYTQNHSNLDEIEQRLYETDRALTQKYITHKQTDIKTNQNYGKSENVIQSQVNPLSKQSGLKSVLVYSSNDLSGAVLIELAEDALYSSRELINLWEKNTGIPAGTKTINFISNVMGTDDFRVEITGANSELTIGAGNALKNIMSNIDGVSSIEDNLTPNKPQIRFSLTPDGRAMGFTTAEIAKQVLQNFGGGVVQSFQRDKDEVNVTVRYPLHERTSLASIQTANVRSPRGYTVPLSTVAKMSQEFTTDQIRRIDGQRAVFISAKIDKKIIAPRDLISQLKNTDIDNISHQFPGVKFSFKGEAEEQSETTASMQTTFSIALLIIYMILAIALSSYTQPLLIMAVIPFGIVGAILGHWLTGISISVFSLNGILALTGVVINDSLLLMSRYNENVKQGVSPSNSIAEAATSRFRAVVLTSLTTFFGLLPLLFETSHQAQFLKPAAASLAYGILFATVVTLVLIPILVNISQDLKFWKKNT